MSVFDLIEGYLVGLPYRDLDSLDGFDPSRTKGFRTWDRLQAHHIRAVDRGCLNNCPPSVVRSVVAQILYAGSRQDVVTILGSVVQ
jgi:hypothetical protein